MSVLQTVQKKKKKCTYGQTVQKNNNNNLHMDRQCKKTTNNLHMDRQCKKTALEHLQCSRQCKKNNNNLHMDSTYLQTVQKTMCKRSFENCKQDRHCSASEGRRDNNNGGVHRYLIAVVRKLYLTKQPLMHKLDALNKCLICSLCRLALRNRDELMESRHSFPIKT